VLTRLGVFDPLPPSISRVAPGDAFRDVDDCCDGSFAVLMLLTAADCGDEVLDVRILWLARGERSTDVRVVRVGLDDAFPATVGLESKTGLR